MILYMIVLNLTCGNQHQFEGWFASAEEFVRQSETTLVSCPYCSDANITRLPSGPHVKRAVATATAKPEQLIAAMTELARNSEDVGAQFPEEARKIHYEEVVARSIRGIASASEVKALIEEGIAVLPLPILSKGEVH